MTRADLVCRLVQPNVKAFLGVVRAALRTSSTNGYSLLPDGSHFSGWIHPKTAVSTPDGRNSTRAGAYQIMARTWETLQDRYGFMEFDQDCQDQAAVAMLDICGALHPVMAGEFEQALEQASHEWPELASAAAMVKMAQADFDAPIPPPSPLPWPAPPDEMTLSRAIEIYRTANGTFVPAGATCSRPVEAAAKAEPAPRRLARWPRWAIGALLGAALWLLLRRRK